MPDRPYVENDAAERSSGWASCEAADANVGAWGRSKAGDAALVVGGARDRMMGMAPFSPVLARSAGGATDGTMSTMCSVALVSGYFVQPVFFAGTTTRRTHARSKRKVTRTNSPFTVPTRVTFTQFGPPLYIYPVRVIPSFSRELYLLGADFDYRSRRDLVFCLHRIRTNVVNLFSPHTLGSHFRY